MLLNIHKAAPVLDGTSHSSTFLSLLNLKKRSYWRLLLLLLFSCNNHHAEITVADNPILKQQNFLRDINLIKKDEKLLQDGDLVLRTGNDFISLSLKKFSLKDPVYSHCGLVQIKNDSVYIYNAIGGEENPDAKLRKESFISFCNPANNLGFAIYRYSLTALQHQRLDSIVEKYYQQQIPFDMQFNLQSDDRLYCSEFVYKSLIKATRDSVYLSLSHAGKFVYVAIDNLYLNKHCKKIIREKFQ